jgi:hypothetical protein
MDAAARAILILALLGIAGACAYAFFGIFDTQASPGGIGSGALAVLLLLIAVLAARKGKKPPF